MAKIIFDNVGEKGYRYGVSKTVLYPQTSGAYPLGVAFNGVTAINQNPSGAEETAIYADNIKYASLMSAEDFGAGIEAVWYPEEWAECDGEKSALKGVYVGQQTRRPFGLCWRNELGSDVYDESDDNYELHLAYGMKAKPSSKSDKTTNASPENETYSWDCTSTPVPVPNMNQSAHLRINVKDFEDKQKIKDLEDVLYGTEDADPRLPLPEEVYSILGISV